MIEKAYYTLCSYVQKKIPLSSTRIGKELLIPFFQLDKKLKI